MLSYFYSLLFNRNNMLQPVTKTLNDEYKNLSEVGINTATQHYINILTMTRSFPQLSDATHNNGSNNTDNALSDESNQIIDAVMGQISKLVNVPAFNLVDRGQVLISYQDKPIQITKDIYVKISKLIFHPNGSTSSITIMLMSNTISASAIFSHVKSIHYNYLQDLKNSIGNNIYFFDQKSKEGGMPPPPHQGSSQMDIMNYKRMVITTSTKQLAFTMMPFYSNKTFANIYGKEVRKIEQRVRFFLDNKDWYDSKGIPYQLGMLLSGIPGSGKTSIIRAIANMTRRHIINVNFANITTASQLKNLFYCDKIQVYSDNTMSTMNSYYIPIDQRLYILEEIDAIGNIVKQRSSNDCGNNSHPMHDELTLMEILTIMDGTMEIPGRMIIMTSNHPENLDQALVRPGRIDVQANFGKATREQICEMFEGYLDRPFPTELIDQLPENALTPAEVGQVLFRHFNTSINVQNVVDDLYETVTNKY